MFLTVLPRIVFIIITHSLLFNCETETVSDLFACPDPPSIIYLETNSSVTKYIDYRSNCARQWLLKREGYNYNGSNLEVVKEAILILSHLDLDSSAGDYLLVSNGIPDETYKPKILVITSKINDESKTIAISSPITWIGLVNNAAYKPAISLTFTWVAPELKIKEEIFPTELRSASVDLCFEEIDCPIVSENQQLIKSGLTEMVNQFIYDENSTNIQPIDEQQIKIIRNESRINDEQVSVNKYCRVQLAVTSEVDINWAHPELTKEILTTIWLSTNTSAQTISIPGDRLSFKTCQDESFDPFITLQSAGIFIAGLGASIGLWRWHHSHVLSAKKAIKPKVDSVLASTETKHNPIYESDGENDEDYVLGERDYN